VPTKPGQSSDVVHCLVSVDPVSPWRQLVAASGELIWSWWRRRRLTLARWQ